MNRTLSRLLAVSLLGGLATCADRTQFEPYAKAIGTPTLTLGGVEVELEVAASKQERAQGLMYRDSMPENHGMLFVYAAPKPLHFWMKNTFLPLDIAFIAEDGTITNIEAMQPLEEGPGATSIKAVPYALEMNQGWFQRHGVKAGDKIEIPEWVKDLAPEDLESE